MGVVVGPAFILKKWFQLKSVMLISFLLCRWPQGIQYGKATVSSPSRGLWYVSEVLGEYWDNSQHITIKWQEGS
jgi:hypothetical protein